jgi:nicotinate-nucleotide pyrophosphorylase (carboxylating)
MTDDLRDTIFASVADRVFTADVRVTTAGVISGVELAGQKALDLGCDVLFCAADGDEADVETPILSIRGSAKAIAMAEDCIPGGSGRISNVPFLYLDKNYVRIFGSVRKTLEAVAPMQGFVRAIQLRGLVEDIALEARSAIELRAEILMVDSGRLEDLDLVARLVREAGRREQTTIAFAGDIAMEDIAEVVTHDVDILDIGRAVLDAPIVDIKFDVRTG